MGRKLVPCRDCHEPRTEAIYGKRRGRQAPLCRSCKEDGATPAPPLPRFLHQAIQRTPRGRAHLRRLKERPTDHR